MTKDKLIIAGKTYVAGPVSNIHVLDGILNLSDTCQRCDQNAIVFQGVHSVYSNLHPADFTLEKTKYNCVEQYYQSKKAQLFDDDAALSKIMCETNPYRIKKLGMKIRKFDYNRWRQEENSVMYRALKAKFIQNKTLKQILLSTGEVKIGEATFDTTWGIGMQLFDTNALSPEHWERDGSMCELLSRLRSELRK